MILIVGLGNPGSKYVGTRHNVGFEAVDLMVNRFGGSWESNRKVGGETCVSHVGESKVLLLKPSTFMNRSGEVVRKVLDFYKLSSGVDGFQCLLIHDEVDFSLGRMKIQRGGGPGGHNGVASVKSHVGGLVDWGDVVRLRLGVGRPDEFVGREMVDWVLGQFGKDERGVVDEMVRRCVGAIELLTRDGVDAAMNEFNGK